MTIETSASKQASEDILTFEDIIDFFGAAKVAGKCPACSFDKWSIVQEVSSDDGIARHAVIPLGNTERGYWDGYNFPMIICRCNRCAYIRMHSRTVINAWVQGGKKEIGENGL